MNPGSVTVGALCAVMAAVSIAATQARELDSAPLPLLAIDRNRATVVERIVTQWGDALAQAKAGITADQLREMLLGMRADQLLAASLVGNLEGLRNVVAAALVSESDVTASLLQAKALGDANQDVVYVPVTPCRLVETRGTFAAVYQGGGPFATNEVRTYTLQGGNGVCLSQLPASVTPSAVQMQVYGIPTTSGSGDLEILPQGGTFGSTATLVYLGNNAFTSASSTSLANLGNKQISVQVRGPGAHVAIDVVGYFRAPVGGFVTSVATGAGLTGGPITSTGTINLATTQLLPTTACANSQIPRWNGSAWTCSTDANSGGTVTNVATGAGLTGGPITTTGTVGLAATQLLPTVACSAGQVPLWSGSAWTCAAAGGTGTVTSVGSGTGLSGGPITTTGALSIAASYQLPQSCANGQVPKSNGAGGWTCAADGDTTYTAGNGLMLTGTTFAITNSCASGQVLKWNGSAWACSADANSGGTVTSVGTGTGLTGGPITGSGSLSIAASYQLPQSCTNGQVPKSNGAGGWTCASDATGTGTVTSITAGAGLTGGTITTSGTIAVDPASMTLTGDVTGTQAATVVSQVGGQSAANVAAGLAAANAAASANTASTIVKRDASGDFAAGTITASVAGAASANVLKAGDTMTGSLTLSAGSLNLSAGNLNLAASTPTGGNITKGGTYFIHDSGTQNVFVGRGAGNLGGVTGAYNAALGAFALQSITTGSSNTAIGTGALSMVTTGSSNTAAGNYALSQNTQGHFNTAHGVAALSKNSVGGQNAAVGYYSLGNNTTASLNTAVGTGALGNQAFANSGVAWNTENTAIGSYSLSSNDPTSTSNGIRNTAVGASALWANTTGFYNTAVGHGAGSRNGAGTGYGGGAITFVTNPTGSYNTFLGYGTGATASVSNCTAVGIDAYCDANDQVRLGNIFVNSIGGKVGWSALSDARAKEDIRELDLGLDFVLGLRPVSYRLKGGNGRTDMGFLAQDVEAALGDAYNVVDVGGDLERTLSLRYQDLVAPLVKAVQEQQETIRELRARLARLEALLARER
ncbi:MAG: tail fiber domain-containing protein [Burkholderiales bacterium]